MSNNTVLLVVDVQHAFYDGDTGPSVHDSEASLERIVRVLESARANDVPVVFVQHEGPPGHPLEPNAKGWILHNTMKVTTETVVKKSRPDAFQGTDLQAQLDNLKTVNLVVAGNQTEFCIDTTCRRAQSLGYEVTLLSDCHSTWDNEILKAGQIKAHHNFVLGRQFVTLIKAEEIDWCNL